MERKWRSLSKKALSPEEGKIRREVRNRTTRNVPRSKDGFCPEGGVFIQYHLTEKDREIPWLVLLFVPSIIHEGFGKRGK